MLLGVNFSCSLRKPKDGQRRILPWSCTTTEECDEYVTPCFWEVLAGVALVRVGVLVKNASGHWTSPLGHDVKPSHDLARRWWMWTAAEWDLGRGFRLEGPKRPQKIAAKASGCMKKRSEIELRMMACKVSKAETQSETQVVRGRCWWNLHPNWSGTEWRVSDMLGQWVCPLHPGHPKALDLTLPCRRPGEIDVTKDIKRLVKVRCYSGVACTCSRPKDAVSLLMKVRAWVDQTTTGTSPCLFVPSDSVRKDPEPNPQVLFFSRVVPSPTAGGDGYARGEGCGLVFLKVWFLGSGNVTGEVTVL